MSFDVLFNQFMSGIARSALLFLVASGLSLTFGVLRVLNFAHGSLYMLGAFISYSIWKFLLMPVLGFYVAAVIAAIVMGGTPLTGGAGGVHRSIIGVLIITVLSNGMNVAGVQLYVQIVIKGIVMMLAVAMTLDRSRIEFVK